MVSYPIRLVSVRARDDHDKGIGFPFPPAQRGRSERDREDECSRFPAIRRQAFLSTANLPFVETFRFRIPAFSAAGCVVPYGSRQDAQANLIIAFDCCIRFRFDIRQFNGDDLRHSIRHVAGDYYVFKNVLSVRVAGCSRLTRFLLCLFLPVLTMGPNAIKDARLYIPCGLLVVRPAVGRVKAGLRFVMVISVRILVRRAIVQHFSILSRRVSEHVARMVEALYHDQRSQREGRTGTSVPSKCRDHVHLMDRVIKARVGVSRIARRYASAKTFFIRVGRIRLLAQACVERPTSTLRGPRDLKDRPLVMGHVGRVEILRVRHVSGTHLRAIFLVGGHFVDCLPVRVTVVAGRVDHCLRACLQISHEGGCKEVNHGAIRRPFARSLLVFRRIVMRPRFGESEGSATGRLYAEYLVRYDVGFHRHHLSCQYYQFVRCSDLTSNMGRLPFKGVFHRQADQRWRCACRAGDRCVCVCLFRACFFFLGVGDSLDLSDFLQDAVPAPISMVSPSDALS